MRYHSSLIKHYISIKDTPEEIAKKLIVKTCEVEEIIQRKLPEKLVIGKVISIRQHPQADKLVVCVVDCGPEGSYTICTGGENIVEHSFVPVALPGCYLPVIDLQIEPRTMRGEPSHGMICSKGEIGINEDEEHHWIRTLQYTPNTPAEKMVQVADFDDITDTDCGIPLKEKYPRLEAYIFDVDNKTVTNRPDLTGHFGLARELQAMYANNASTHITRNKLPTLIDTFTYTSTSQLDALGKHHNIPIDIQCNGVKVYNSVYLSNCQMRPSTFLTRTILRDCGLLPRLNWVDAGNTFMMLTGQPIHCFDADSISGGITVRYANDGEQFTDLTDTQHTLTSSDIVIADNEKILALAGIIGGKSTAISEYTKNVFVEIAHFDPVAIRKTGTRLALRTDAELRYEKQINPQYTTHALHMFLDFLHYAKKDLGEYTLEGISVYTSSDYTDNALQIPVDWKRISQTIYGDDSLTPETSQKILANLGYTFQEDNVIVPWWRGTNDMHGLHDIIEEVIRIHGYETISGKPLIGGLTLPENEATVAIQRTFEETLVHDFNMTQVETYPWLHEKHIGPFSIDTSRLFSLQNPPAPELMYLRDSMLYGLLDVITKNAKIYDTINIFDIGKIWNRVNGEKQEDHVSGMLFYNNMKEKLRENDTFFLAKQAIEQLSTKMIKGYTIRLEQSTLNYFHSKKQATIYVNDTKIGYIASLHPRIIELAKLDENTSITYVSLSLTQIATLEKTQYTPIYETLQDQIISRDFCFVIDKDTPWITLENAISTVEEIREINMFDIYTGDKIPAGKKAIAFSCKIYGDGTLKTEEINVIMDKVIQACESTGATLR